jgi:2,3-bisphosphoglycerate-dependent phosphoglycerate mutase
MQVFCVRHGEREANAGLVTSDPLAVELTTHGQVQAEVLSRQWFEAPALIVSSPARRAISTAEPTCKRFSSTALEIWSIQEFTYLAPARCAGKTVDDRRAWVGAYWDRCDPAYVDGAGAASFDQFSARVDACLSRLRSTRGDGWVLLFGHGQFINAVRWRMSRPDISWQMKTYRAFDVANMIPTGGIVELEIR